MKVEPISNGYLRIWLSDEDCRQQQGSMQKALHRVLQAAGKSLSRLGKRLVAECIPVSGGYIVLLSAHRRADSGIQVYHVASLDNLYRLAQAWAAVPPEERPQTALYEADAGYHVVLYPAQPLSRRVLSLLRAYGHLCARGALAAAQTAEYGRLLAAGDALAVLTGREPHSPEPPGRAH